MKKSVLSIIFILLTFSSFTQPLAIIGFNGTSPDGYSIVITEAIGGGVKVYFTDAEYVSGTNAFNSGEGTWSWTTPAGGVAVGEVITFAENSANVLSLNCSSGSGAACGSFIFEAGTSIAIGTGGAIPEGIYAYTDTDSNKENGIGGVIAVIYSDGTIPAGEDPSTDFPDAVVVDGFAVTGHKDFMPALRSGAVSLSDIENPANYTAGSGNLNLSEMAFANISLPVELIEFKASKKTNQIDLHWITATEINNHYFDIERSKDGIRFESIGKVDGNGNASQTSYYSFSDRTPDNHLNYYRLKQVDYDGKFTYSKMVSVEYRNQHSITIFPSPFKESVNISFAEKLDIFFRQKNRTIEIYDAYGKLIKNIQTTSGETNIEVNLSKLSSGTYLVKIQDGQGEVSTQRIIKF